jgi:hypothetical protein
MKNVEFLSEHLLYEIWMLFKTALFLSQNDMQFYNSDIFPRKNAFLESFVIHARLIINFLFPNSKSQYNDDVNVDDFIKTDGIWKTKYKEIPDYLKKIQTPINKSTAHLTYYRIDKKQKWDISKISKELGIILKEFFYEIDEDALKKEFIYLYNEIDRELWNKKEPVIVTTQYASLYNEYKEESVSITAYKAQVPIFKRSVLLKDKI